MNTSEMSKNEAIEMMARAANEIEDLRGQVERLRPRAEAYDRLTQILDLLPDRRPMGYTEDVASKLRKRIMELKAPPPIPQETDG